MTATNTPVSSSERTSSGVLRPGIPSWAVVWLACLCGFMTVMDTSIVNVALPAMRSSLRLSSGDQQWVVDAYLLTLGGFLLLGSRASDLFGRRRVLIFGVVVFTLGSLAGGLAQEPVVLLVARAVQGVGGAVLSPASLALIIAALPDGPARSKALTLYQGASAIAVTLGVLLGGLLTQELSWRWVMFVNVPVGVGLLLAGGRFLDPAYRGRPGERLDVPGAVTVTVAVGALIEGLANAQQHSWTTPLTVGLLAAGAVLLVAFALIETRVDDPLVRLDVFRVPGIAAGTLILALNGTVLTASTLFVSLVLQSNLHHGAFASGAALMPFVLASVAAGFAAMTLMAKTQPRYVVSAGFLIAAGGFGWLGALGSHPTYTSNILGPLLVAGAGLGAAVVPTTRAASAAVAPHDASLASGLFSTARQLGSAIGIAALVTIAVAQTHTHTMSRSSGTAAALHGNAIALLTCGGISTLAAVAALLLPNPHNTHAA